MTFRDISRHAADILLLIGSDEWIQYPKPEILDALQIADQQNTIIGGICAATLPLAQTGLLNDRNHTSNTPEFLIENAPNYTGETRYIANNSAITDGNIITASGLSALSFARDVFKLAAGDNPSFADAYFDAYRQDFLAT